MDTITSLLRLNNKYTDFFFILFEFHFVLTFLILSVITYGSFLSAILYPYVSVAPSHHRKNGPERTKKDEATSSSMSTSTSDYREKLFSVFSTRKRRDRSLHLLHYHNTATDTLKRPLHKSSQQRSVSWETSDSKDSMSLIWGSDRLSGFTHDFCPCYPLLSLGFMIPCVHAVDVESNKVGQKCT